MTPPMTPWIDWKGGECPVPPETMVIVRCRADPDGFDFDRYRNFRAGDLLWRHFASAPSSDIIAYRVVKEVRGPR